MSEILLSICIPTFNRERYLDETLRSITSQLTDELLSKVEICVSDNASTDGTDRLLRDYQDRFDNVVTFRWDRNMGADYNYLKAVEIASGEYCWYLGSDDCLLPGSIDRILNLTKSGDDIIIFDRADSDISMTREPVHVAWSALSEGCAFHTLNDRSRFLRYLSNCTSFGALFSYLSVIVFKRSRWVPIDHKDRFVGSAYVHTHVLLQILHEGANFRYLKEPFVLCRTGNDSFLSDNSVRGSYRRIKLDVDGYRDIPVAVFGSDSEEYLLIRRLVGRCLPVIGLLKIKLACFNNGDAETIDNLDRLLKNSGFIWKAMLLSLLGNKLMLRWFGARNKQDANYCKELTNKDSSGAT